MDKITSLYFIWIDGMKFSIMEELEDNILLGKFGSMTYVLDTIIPNFYNIRMNLFNRESAISNLKQEREILLLIKNLFPTARFRRNVSRIDIGDYSFMRFGINSLVFEHKFKEIHFNNIEEVLSYPPIREHMVVPYKPVIKDE